MPKSPRLVASASPSAGTLDTNHVKTDAKSLKEAAWDKLSQQDRSQCASETQNCSQVAKVKKKKRKQQAGMESMLGKVDFGMATDGQDQDAPVVATKAGGKKIKRRTPQSMDGAITKTAKLFAEIVPGIEESVQSLSPPQAVDSASSALVPDVSAAASHDEPSQSKEKVRKKGVKRRLSNSEPTTAEPRKKRSTPAQVELLGSAAYRNLHHIVVPDSCPPPLETFDYAAVDFGEPLVTALRSQGYLAPTPIQAQAWPIAVQGKDLVAVAKTGSGKTCGFLLPALARLRQLSPTVVPKKGKPSQPHVLILAPTRELAQQIAQEGAKFSHVSARRIVAIYGGVPKGDQVRELQQGADVLVATPGRLLDFSADKPDKGQGALVCMKQVSYLVLDEADRMLDMGFEADIRKIVNECPKSKASGDSSALVRQTLFFTATWPKSVQTTAASLTSSNAVQLRIGQSGEGGDKLTANANINQTVMFVDERQKLTHLKDILQKEVGPGESCFVFARTKRTCDYLEQKLWDEKEELSIGTWCRAIHSHKEQWTRDENLATFRSITTGKDNGRRGILVATDVAARGLDIPGVALVVIYDFGGGSLAENGGVESYVHRIGRTGRAGKSGKAFTFFTEDDTGAAKFVALLDEAKQSVPGELRALAAKSARGKGSKGGKGSGGKGGKGSGGKGGKGFHGKGGKHGKGGGKFGKGGKSSKGKGGKSSHK